MQRTLKWGSNIVTVILGIVLILTLVLTVSSRLNNGIPKIFGLEMYQVLSGSMEPEIHTGSVIFVKPQINIKGLKVGDVITFKVPQDDKLSAGAIVTHRIKQITSENGLPAFKTKGDANPAPDQWTIPASNVIAEYDNITIPYIGYYLNFLKTKLGIVIMLILPGALLIVSTLISLFREIFKLQKAAKVDTVSETTSDTSMKM